MNELVERCVAVGWPVVKSGNSHWKVDTRNGILTIPSTPSSDTSVKNTLAQAKRFGLDVLEARMGLKQEKQRIARIAFDRQQNDAKIDAINSTNGNGETRVTSEDSDDITRDRGHGHVAGVAIVETAPAMVKTNVMSKPAPLRDAEELLLANDTVVYRCLRTDPYGSLLAPSNTGGKPCHLTFPSSYSVRQHIGTHSRLANRMSKKEEEDVKAAVSAPVAVRATTETHDGTLEQFKTELLASVQALLCTIEKIGASSIEARNVLLRLADVTQLLKTEIVVQEPDPDLVAKAEAFDALSATLKGLIK